MAGKELDRANGKGGHILWIKTNINQDIVPEKVNEKKLRNFKKVLDKQGNKW